MANKHEIHSKSDGKQGLTPDFDSLNINATVLQVGAVGQQVTLNVFARVPIDAQLVIARDHHFVLVWLPGNAFEQGKGPVCSVFKKERRRMKARTKDERGDVLAQEVVEQRELVLRAHILRNNRNED